MDKKYPTPHINAAPEDIAPVVLMPGDPKRSEYIAKSFLDSPVLFNSVRGVNGYTGSYNGKRISVMASGMGMPSIGIYSYELYNFFGVEAIIRVGSAGSLRSDIKLRDLVLGMGACTDSAYSKQFGLAGSFSPICDFSMLKRAVELAEEKELRYHVGNLLSSDIFYNDDPKRSLEWSKMGVMAVEMEAAALYMNAARAGKKALAMCTISDSLVEKGELTALEREQTLNDMITLALELGSEYSFL